MNSYATLTLLGASPEAYVEPITLAQAKGYLNLPELSPPDTQSDDEVTALIVAARIEGEKQQNRDLVRKQWQLSLDYWPSSSVEIPLRAPLVSVDAITYRDSDGVVTELVPGVDYIVDLAKQPGVVMPPYNASWPEFTPWPTGAITITFTSGYAEDAAYWSSEGALVKIGMKRLISLWYVDRLPGAVPPEAAALLSHGAVSRFA